ncbi:MAG: DUF5916 domain-containing protein [Bacteroidota bacterium]
MNINPPQITTHSLVWLLLYLLTSTVTLKAKERPTDALHLTESEHTVQLDGRLDDSFWKEARRLPMTMSQPTMGAHPTQPVIMQIGQRDGALYIAGQIYWKRSDIDEIRQLSRDDLDQSSDLVGVVIDGYNDEENANVFITSPSGHKADLAISNDAESDKNLNWDAYWDVEVHRTQRYWSFEMRIPLSSIQFQQQDGKIELGLSMWNYRATNNEVDSYPQLSNEYGFDGYYKPSQAADIQLVAPQISQSQYLTPYVLGGIKAAKYSGQASTRSLLDEVGGDAKYRLSSNFTLDATLNTDFSQVESDDQRINLTRFSIYQPEKRSFFQERAGLFDFNTGGPTTLFYSRRIGLTEEGQPVPLYGGLRLTGRTGHWDVGLLNMQSTPKYGLSSENFGVVRLRRSISDTSSSYLGMMMTSRLGTGQANNWAYGLDGVWALPHDTYVTTRAAQTINSGTSNKLADQANILATIERRSYTGFFYEASINWVGGSYEPALGFVDRRDFIRFGDRVAYGWEGGNNSPLQKYQLIGDWSVYRNQTHREVESIRAAGKTYVELKSGLTAQLGYNYQWERLYEGFDLSDEADIPQGSFGSGLTYLFVSTPQGNTLRLSGTGSLGRYFDGQGVSLESEAEWTMSAQMELQSELKYYHIDFPERDQTYETLLVRARMNIKPTARWSLSAMGQYNTLTRFLSAFARMRLNIADGSDLYIVYRYGSDQRANHLLPDQALEQLQTLQAKFTYTFQR